jgi:hypothetical protein
MDPLAEREPEPIDLIASVLQRAHVAAVAHDEPDEARVILHVAQSFADELAVANPCFDRLGFIRDATEHARTSAT